jgi:hypothetical protein
LARLEVLSELFNSLEDLIKEKSQYETYRKALFHLWKTSCSLYDRQQMPNHYYILNIWSAMLEICTKFEDSEHSKEILKQVPKVEIFVDYACPYQQIGSRLKRILQLFRRDNKEKEIIDRMGDFYQEFRYHCMQVATLGKSQEFTRFAFELCGEILSENKDIDKPDFQNKISLFLRYCVGNLEGFHYGTILDNLYKATLLCKEIDPHLLEAWMVLRDQSHLFLEYDCESNRNSNEGLKICQEKVLALSLYYLYAHVNHTRFVDHVTRVMRILISIFWSRFFSCDEFFKLFSRFDKGLLTLFYLKKQLGDRTRGRILEINWSAIDGPQEISGLDFFQSQANLKKESVFTERLSNHIVFCRLFLENFGSHYFKCDDQTRVNKLTSFITNVAKNIHRILDKNSNEFKNSERLKKEFLFGIIKYFCLIPFELTNHSEVIKTFRITVKGLMDRLVELGILMKSDVMYSSLCRISLGDEQFNK